MIAVFSIIMGITLLIVAVCIYERFIGVRVRIEKYLEKMRRINKSIEKTKEVF